MPIEKLLALFTLISAVIGMYWKGTKMLAMFALLQHLIWKREGYFGRHVKMGLLDEMV